MHWGEPSLLAQAMPCSRAPVTFFRFGAVALVMASKFVVALACACIAVAGAVVAASCLVPNGAASSYLVLPMPCKAVDIYSSSVSALQARRSGDHALPKSRRLLYFGGSASLSVPRKRLASKAACNHSGKTERRLVDVSRRPFRRSNVMGCKFAPKRCGTSRSMGRNV